MKWTILALLMLSSCSYAAKAQDTIYKKDDARIIAKVVSIDDATVTYKRFDNPDGPDYVILRNSIRKIVYKNGIVAEDDFSGNDSKTYYPAKKKAGEADKKTNKGNNIFSIIPGAYTAEVFEGSMNDPGVGVSYERLLDPGGHIGVCIPLIISFVQNGDYSSNFWENNQYYGTGGNVPAITKTYHTVFLMPEIKFYPARKNSRFRYSLGGPFFMLFGKTPAAVYNYYSTSSYSSYAIVNDQNYQMYGFAISNSFGISATEHVYLEFNANLMVPFSDNRRPNIDGNGGTSYAPIVQYTLKIGYKY